MSHFTVLVTGDDVEAALAPFDETLELPRRMVRTREQMIADSRASVERYAAEGPYAEYIADPAAYIKAMAKRSGTELNADHIAYLAHEFPKKLAWTDEEHYADEAKWIDDLDEDGNEWSTANDKAKWDWWTVGGRWPGVLRLLPGEVGAMGERSWVFDREPDAYPDAAGRADIAKRHQVDVAATAEQGTFAILHDGKWISRAEMGWFGMERDETCPESEWPAKWAEVVEALPADLTLTVVDCHI